MKARLFVKSPEKFLTQFSKIVGKTIFEQCEPQQVKTEIVITIPEEHRTLIIETANKLSLLVKPLNDR